MPIFDNELLSNIPSKAPEGPMQLPPSPSETKLDTHIDYITGEPVSTAGGGSLAEIAQINIPNTHDANSPFQIVTKGELIANKKYPMYERGVDLENIYGLNQNFAKQLGSGLVKGVGVMLGTFAQGFTDIPNTISAIKNKDFSKLSGDPNGFEGNVDRLVNNLEDLFPNYMTRQERDHPYLAMIPGFAGSANFWGNSVIKNLGFTAGAIANAFVTDLVVGAVTGGVGAIPLVASQYTKFASKIGKLNIYLSELLSDGSKAGKFIENIKTLGLAAEKEAAFIGFAETKFGKKFLTETGKGLSYGLKLWTSAQTEAGVEGRQAYKTIKEELTQHYIDLNGEAPTGAELDKIEQYAVNGMNTRFGINMALLTVSNAIQFDNLFKSFSTASSGVKSSIVRDIEEAGKIGLKEGSLNEFEIKAPLTIKGKIWDAVKPKLPTILSEGVYEEGGQFAAEKGVTDYYTRKYKNKGDWDGLNEVIKSTTTGLKEQFGSQEGIENMLVGGISALISGGILNRVNTIKGQGKDVQLQRALNSLNAYGLTGMLDQKYENTGNSVAIAKEMQQAAQEGNILKYKNLKHDQFFNFVISRIPSGMHDVTIEQLEMLKGLSKEDFEKTFGMDFSTSNKNTVNEYVDQLITNANKIKDNVDSLDAVFKNPFKFTTNPETKEESENNDNYKIFNNWKTDIAYFNSQSSDYNSRLLSMNESLAKINPLVDVSLAKSLLNPESLKNYSQEYEEKAALLESTILPTTSIQDRRAIKEEVKSLRTLSEKINLMLNSKQTDLKLLTNVLNFEINGQDFLQEPQVSSDKVVNILDYSRDINIIDASKKEIAKRIEAMTSKEGFEKYFEPEIIDSTPLAKQEIAKKPYDVGREYENPATKTAKVRKITDGRFKVTAPNGEVTFYKTREEANEIAKDLNKDFSDLAKVKVLAINEDGSIKVEDLAGNIQNIPADFLKEYSGLESDEEKIAKQQEQLDKQQKEIEKKSGTVATGNPDTEDIEPEAAKKAAEKFFKSSITESEDWANPNESAPHVKNAREFLLNAKNFPNRENLRAILVTPNSENKLGLTGLTALSYGTNDSSKSTDAEEGFVAQVFVEQDGSKLFFVDKEGKRIGEVGSPIDVNSVIFQTMPTTSITTSKGKSRARTGEEDKLEIEAKRWKAQRELLFKQDGSKSQAYEFIISRGVPVTSDTENFHVAESLGIPVKLISKTQDLILISTTGFITHNGQNIQFPKGRPVLQYGDTLQPLQNTKITPSESQTIFQCILNISNDILNATKEGKKFNIQGMKETAFLQNILFWGKGQKTPNQIYIDGTNLHVGKTSFPLTEIADKQSEIQEAVTGLYRNINNTSLKDISVKFREQRFDGKELVEVEWKNYQEYLLSSKNPDGSSRNTTSTPLVTNIVAPTELAPINFKQKYATLEQIEYPQVATPVKQEAKTEVPTTNTISIMGQNVPFTYTEEDGNFTVEIQSSEATKVLAENDELVNKYTSILKSVNLPVADNAEQIIIDFLSLQKAAQLKKAAEEKAKEVVAPAVVDTKVDLEKKLQIANDEYDLINYQRPNAPKRTLEEQLEIINSIKAELASQVNGAENLTNGEDKTAPLDTKKIKPRDADYMRVGGEEIVSATPEQFEEFKKWHAENVPNIPFEVLENLVNTFDGEKAFGVFEDGVAKFYKGAPGTTAYHEVFEGVWKHFLTLDEKNAIIQELRDSVKDFKDRATGKTLNYATATDEQIKERIADDFGEFKAGKIPAKSLIGKIVDFFRNIMNFFKSFVQKPTLKESLFKEIEKGRFKESKISTVDSNPEYSRVPGLTETQVYELTQDMTALSSFYLFGIDNKRSLYDVAKVTSKELFDWIKGEYVKQDLYEQLGNARWNQLVEYTKENLKTIGVSFKKNEDNIDEETIDINSEGANKNDYDGNPFKQDWKKNSPYAVKLSLLVPKTVYTNQENKTELEIPERQTTSYQGYKLANFNKMFVSLMDKLANTTSVSKFIDKFFNLAKRESDLVVPFKRLGANLDGSIDFSKFKKDDWRLFVDYMRVFTKQRPDAVIQYTNEGSTYIAPANQFTASKNIESQWFEEMKALSSKDDGIIKKDKQAKTYKIDLKSTKLPKTIEETLDFLNEMGINFPMDVYNRLTKKEQTAVLKAGGNIYTYIQSNPTVATLDGKILGINGPLNTLSNIIVKTTNPNIDSTHFNVEGERVGSYTENNFPSEFENIFNETSTLDKLLEAMPQLKDVYAQGSQILKKGGLFFDEDGNRIATIKVGTTGGSKNINEDKGTSISKLTLGNRFIQEINNNLQGNYYILIPADGSTEWMLNLGNPISFKDVQEGRGNNEIVSIFKDYLDSEIELALQDGRSKISNVGSKAKELRFFKEILLEKDVIAIQDLLAENDAQGIQDYLKENKESIKSAIIEYFNNNVADLKSNLQNNQQLLGIDGNYSIPNMLSEFLSSNKINNGEISEQTLNDILFFLQANYAIANMEMHKVLFGDPYQFKIKNNQLDETKRVKSFLSPRRRTFDSVPFNNFLNTEYNKAQDIELDEKEFGYHTHKAYTNTSTLSDVELVGSVALMEDMPEEIRDAYSKTNEADAASFLLDNTYREVKLKNSQWSNEAEEWHQWHLAYARQNMPGYVYVNKELAKQDAITVSKPEPKFIADVLKPIVSGVKYNQDFANLVLDKFSQMPLYYKWVQGTNLEKLYLQMHKENKGYVVMISGRKAGSEGEHSIYNDNGSFNTEEFNNNIQVPWTAYGVQVENAYEKPKDQTRGSQSVKLVSMDLFEGGKPLGATPERQEVIQKAYDRNNDILDEMHNNAYINLLSKIGVEDMGDSFKLSNPTVVSETLSNELLRREMNRNDKETIQLDENGEFAIPFEASPAYYKIKSILYSLVNKALISPKLNGAPHVQAPVTLQESGNRKLAIKTETGYKRISQKEYNALTEEQKKKVVLTDDTLKFYTRAEPWCEVLLPHWFREKLGKHANKTDEELINYLNNHPDGKKILMGIGFRIPTQSVSSMEVFKVKGFLPKSMGYTVIVPSEITTKAGSDFDIDKLNMYLKSIYIDQNGDIQLVKYINNEAETKAFYSRVYDRKLESQILNKAELFDAATNLVEDLDDPKNLIDKYSHILDTMFEDANSLDDRREVLDTIMKKLEKLGDKELQDSLKQDFINNMYKKALENEYYESMQELLSLPETFDRLLSPVSDGGLKDLAATISGLKGDTENNIKTRMLNRTYLTKLRHAFVTGKRWVGIAAVNITSHSIFQKSDVYIDPSRFSEVPKRDQFLLGDGSVILPHNKNSKGLPSLSGVKTAKGDQTISDRLSGYATAFVDIAKDPYIMKLVKSNSVVGTFMFLERLGCGEMGVKFLNQPIISEYLDYLDATDQKGLFNKDNIGYIKSLFPTTEQSLKNSEIDLKNLDSNISNYYINNELQKGSDQSNAEQQHIFDEFLKYAKMAEYNFKITQAINYDTTRFGSGDALTRKQVKTRQAKNNIISDVNEIINNSFLKTQSELLDKSMNSMGAILKLEERTMRDITDEILIPYAERDFMLDDDFDNISNKIKLSFLDYLVQTKSGINDDINTLLLEASGNIQEQLSQAKKAHPEMQILKDLQIESSKRIGGAKTIKLAVNTKEAFEEDNYISMMEELKDIEPELYNSIVKISILQGAAQTAVSIKNIIPLADYAKIVSPIINTLSNTEDVKAFSKGAFQRSNWNDDSIVPKVDSLYFKVLNEGQEYEIVDKYGNVSDYYSLYSSPAFISGKNLGFTGKQLLALDEFNALSKGDFIKIPRIVNVRGTTENVDILTNRSVSNFALRKKAAMGDFSFKDYYGYQLVRDATGEPVTKIETNYKGEQYTKYIYKQINLYGDGKYTAEYRMDTKPSAINNGTVKVEQELSDSMLIQEYGGISQVQENVVPLPSMQQAQAVNDIEREYTPENITTLKPNEVFVFGANTAGGHGGGTAGLAQRGTTSSNYTALPIGTKGKWSEYGIVDKLMQGTEGKSFGIVTKAATISGTSLKIGAKRSVPLSRIEESINALIKTASENPSLKFLVTKFGTNMAGFSEQEMKSLLENKNLPDNIILPKEFEVRSTQSSTSVNEFDLADKLTPIEQNFADGQGGRQMQSQFKGKSTMDLIISGDRTRTTRANTDIQRMAKDYKLSKISDLIGKVIRMTDKTGRQVYTRITKVAPFTQEYQDATWQKEGWVKSVTDKHVGDYPYAIEFEVVNKPTQLTQSSNNIDIKTNFQLKQIAEEENSEGIVLGENEIIYNNVVIGKVLLPVGFKNYTIKGIMLNEEFLNKGLGKAFYKWLGYKATLEGATLNSDFDNTSESAKRVWESLKKEGLAEDTQMGYRFKTVKSTQTVSEQPVVSGDRQISVNQFNITVKSDGTMFYDNGKEVTDQTTKNKVNVRKELQDGTLRSSVYNGSNYFVLSDNRIVGSGKTNLGKESITDEKIKEAILAKAITYKKTC